MWKPFSFERNRSCIFFLFVLVIVHIFKNTECIASEPKASAAIMFRIFKNMNDNLLTDFHVRTTGKTLTDKRRLQPKIDWQSREKI